MNTQDKAILYYMSIATDEKGSQRVGLSAIASLLSCSNPTAKKAISVMVETGHIKEHKHPHAIGRGHGYKWQYWITPRGNEFLLAHGTQGKECYDLLIASKFEHAVNESKKISKNGKAKKVSDKQMRLL